LNVPRFAAIRVASCVTEEEQQDLIRLVRAVQEVRCVTNTLDLYADEPGRRKVQHHARAWQKLLTALAWPWAEVRWGAAPRDQQPERQEGRRRGVQGAAEAH
jgi:hypothetical protein